MSRHRINQARWRRWLVYLAAVATLGAVAATISVGSAGASSARRAAAMLGKSSAERGAGGHDEGFPGSNHVLLDPGPDGVRQTRSAQSGRHLCPGLEG